MASIVDPDPDDKTSPPPELADQITAIFKRERFRVLGPDVVAAEILALPQYRRALGVVDRVLELHRPAESITTRYCIACSQKSVNPDLDWDRLVNYPCPTVRLLDGDV